MKKKIFVITSCAALTTLIAVFCAKNPSGGGGSGNDGPPSYERPVDRPGDGGSGGGGPGDGGPGDGGPGGGGPGGGPGDGGGGPGDITDDTCNMHDPVKIGTGTIIPALKPQVPGSGNPGNKHKENNPDEQLSGAGITSQRQFGYGVYAVTMIPNPSPGAVSSFYLYDNLVTVKGIKSHNGTCRSWDPSKDVDWGTTSDRSIARYTQSLGLPVTDGNIAPPDGTVCAYPSYWREIDIEFVPGYKIENNPVLNHFQASGTNCVGPQTLGNSCDITPATTGSGKISFNTFNIDNVEEWKIKTQTDGNNYLLPQYVDTQNNSNMQVFYNGTDDMFNAPKTYFFYYLPNGAFYTTDLPATVYDFNSKGLIQNSWPSPIFAKTDSTASEELNPLKDKDFNYAKPFAFRYNGKGFNESFTDEGKTALMNISVNVWDGALSTTDYWSGAHSPQQYSASKYWKIAYYPLKAGTFNKDIPPQTQTYLPAAFYSDFSNKKFCESGKPTNFKDMWAVTHDGSESDWWQSYNFYFKDLFANTYIWPLGPFRSSNIICDKDNSLALTIGIHPTGEQGLFGGGNFEKEFQNCGY